jgi:galactose mutarotase-like enzyme
VVAGQKILWELDDDIVSTGRKLAPGGPTDLRLPVTPEIGSLDHCFRVSAGSTSFLSWPDGPTTAITSSDNVSHLQVYTPEDAICVEPQTCAIDAFRLVAEEHEGTGALAVTGTEPASLWPRWS